MAWSQRPCLWVKVGWLSRTTVWSNWLTVVGACCSPPSRATIKAYQQPMAIDCGYTGKAVSGISGKMGKVSECMASAARPLNRCKLLSQLVRGDCSWLWVMRATCCGFMMCQPGTICAANMCTSGTFNTCFHCDQTQSGWSLTKACFQLVCNA